MCEVAVIWYSLTLSALLQNHRTFSCFVIHYYHNFIFYNLIGEVAAKIKVFVYKTKCLPEQHDTVICAWAQPGLMKHVSYAKGI